MSAPLDLVPYKSAVVDDNNILSGDWTRWWSGFWNRVKSAVQLVGTPVTQTSPFLNAAVTTKVLLTVTQGGTYRISTYLRIVVADGVSSSAQITLTWRENLQTCTKTFAAVTGDTVTTVDSQSWTVHADSGTQISYAIAYASNTPNKMHFRADLPTEFVN